MCAHQDERRVHRTTPTEGEETKAQLIGVARKLFAAQGYAGASMEEVCARAEVTRGALYHHFAGKAGLFLAVCEQVAAEVTASVAAAALQEPDAWARLRAGCRAFLEASADDEVRQILLSDAPSVLGWSRFRELDRRHGLGLLKAGIQAAIDEGSVEPGPVDVFAHVLVGSLNEAATVVGRSADPKRARRDALLAIDRLLLGIAGDRGEHNPR